MYLFFQWLLTIIIVNICGFSIQGVFSLAMTIANIFISVSLYGIRNYQISDINDKYGSDVYIAARIITSLSAIVMCTVFVLFNHYTFQTSLCIIAFMIFKLSEGVVDVFHGIDQKLYRMDFVGISCAARGILTCLFFGIVLFITKNLAIAIGAMILIAYTIVIFYDIRKTRSICKIGLTFPIKSISNLLKECFPLLVLTFLSICLSSLPRYFLEYYHGEEKLGYFSSVAAPTLLVQVAASYIFFPIISEFALAYNQRNGNRFFKLLALCFCGIGCVSAAAFVLAFLFGNPVLEFLFKKTILSYSYLLMPMILSTVLMSVVWFLNALLTVMRSFKELVISNAAGVVVCIVLSVLLIPAKDINNTNLTINITLCSVALLLAVFGFIECWKKFKVDTK